MYIFVKNFPRLVIWHLNMRSLINMKSITPIWKYHHSRKYYQVLHILLLKVFLGVLGKSFTT